MLSTFDDSEPEYGEQQPRERDYHRRRGGGPSVAAIALVSALVGGLIASYVGPLLPRQSPPSAPKGQPDVEVRPVPSGTADRAPAVQVAERVGPTVVGVASLEVLQDFFTGRRVTQPAGSGSGVVFDPRGYIVTNYHVVQKADRVVVILPGGEQRQAEIAGIDPPTDLAVIRVDVGRKLSAATFADSDQVRVGETAIAIGNPLGFEFQRSVTVGVVSGIRSLLYGQEQRADQDRVAQLIQTDAAINPGNSGGALVNASGQVIGINTLKIGEQAVEGMGFAIPSNAVKRVADDLVRYGRVRRAKLGVLFSPDVATDRDGRGLVVEAVEPGGPAERAGLKTGDAVRALDGVAINRYVDLVRVLEAKHPGDRVAIRYRRDGRERDTQATLDERG